MSTTSIYSDRDIKSLPHLEQRWIVGEVLFNGAPLIVRYSETAQEWVGHPALSVKLGFAIPLNAQQYGGLPDPIENAQLDIIETIIVDEVLEHVEGLQVLVLTTGMMKEFVFYVTSETDIATIHSEIKKKILTHEVQCIAVVEPDWDSFKEFTPSC